jgi:hypothetical protein
VARTLYRPLETALTRQCAQRYDAGLVLRCLERRNIDESPNDVSLMRVQVHCRGLTQMQARLFVTCMDTGGHDVLCTVEDGRTHRFSYHLPGDAAPSERELGPLAQDLATFLRRELENRLGRLLLQSPARPPSAERGSFRLF